MPTSLTPELVDAWVRGWAACKGWRPGPAVVGVHQVRPGLSGRRSERVVADLGGLDAALTWAKETGRTPG